MKQTRRTFIQSTSAVVGALTVPKLISEAQAANPRKKYNILYLCSDQQHWQAQGSVDPFFDTPHQDALSAESTVFENAFCTTPQCSPSRSSMLTGFYPHRTEMMNNHGASGGTDLKLPTIGSHLQEAGYTTALFGKWHLGHNVDGNAGWDEERKKGPDPKTTELGVDFLERRAEDDKPFALFLMYLDPHDIYYYKPGESKVKIDDVDLPESWAKQDFESVPPVHREFMELNQGSFIVGGDEDDWKGYRDFYRQKVKLYDDHVGRVVAKLKELGLWENTIIVNTSDHGDMDTFHRLVFKGPFMYEHMMRIPMSIRVPGSSGPKRTDYNWVNVDTVPTLMELAGAKVPDCQGQSAASIVNGSKDVPERDYVIGQYYGKQTWVSPIRSIRWEGWKYNLYTDWGEELYDLKGDPEEIENLAKDPKHAKVKRRLRKRLDRWIKENDDPFYSLTTTKLDPNEAKTILSKSKQDASA
ncbi:sulfatase family protein [Pelagicoccus mobilis]|uniref:Sulfatase-like hydrolase/transferase n=1 Tax=Pelagicoccus mobilis TaxID=415221 RepID=A0A934RT89_9BACT|nr:sulfatase-like hydrolase/transferase [Pelagicoccus mobilis]MBK1876452.1 sulfatase-like hydrolase/transferase [Pelagicoccus mobilis]